MIAWVESCVIGLSLVCAAQAHALRPARVPSPASPVARADSPKTLDELRAIEKTVQDVVRRVAPATVAVLGNAGQGSGVIVSRDGLVLTAAHVVLDPGADAIVATETRKARAKVLGIDHANDIAMLKISDAGDWPFVERGESSPLKQGQFVLALGNPSSEYRGGRPPAVRLGRIALSQEQILQTDCVLDHGDSGGPLFDLEGRLIGIHGSIGDRDSINVDIPVDAFSENWEKLQVPQVFGVRALRGKMLGLAVDDDTAGCKITGVVEGSPADKAGFKTGDVVVKFGLAGIKTQIDFIQRLVACQSGAEVSLSVLRDGKVMKMPVKLGVATTRPSRPSTREQSRESPTLKNAFRPALLPAARSVVRVRCQNKDAALGTVVSADGLILTESTCLHEPIACVIGGKTLEAHKIGETAAAHLALLKVNASGLTPIAWGDVIDMPAGAWVAAPSAQGSTLIAAVVSIGRERPANPPATTAPATQPVSRILQHDGNLQPMDYGGPLVNLSGKVVGINIYRGSRTASYAIPGDVVIPLIDAMKSTNAVR